MEACKNPSTLPTLSKYEVKLKIKKSYGFQASVAIMSVDIHNLHYR